MKADELTAVQAAFVLAYTRNGYNAARAYRSARPNVDVRTSEVNGSRMLRVAKVARAIQKLQTARFKRWEMSGDEAAALTALRARADLGQCFDDEGKMLPLDQWPPEIRLAVKGIKADGSVTLIDQQKATETILRMTGKLRDSIDVNHFDHLGYLTAIEKKRQAAQGGQHGQARDVGEDREGGGEGGRAGGSRRSGAGARS